MPVIGSDQLLWALIFICDFMGWTRDLDCIPLSSDQVLCRKPKSSGWDMSRITIRF